jgi:hypothetical protein
MLPDFRNSINSFVNFPGLDRLSFRWQQHADDDERGTLAGWYWQVKNGITRGKTFPTDTMSTINFKRADLGTKPGLRGQRPAVIKALPCCSLDIVCLIHRGYVL